MRSALAHFPKPRNTIRSAITRNVKGTIPFTKEVLLRPAVRAGRTRPRALRKVRVLVRVRRDAAAEDPQLARAVVVQRVPGARRDEHGVADGDPLVDAVDLHVTRALDDEVDLLRDA